MNWGDITLKKFIRLQEVVETGNDTTDLITRLSIIFDKPESYFKGITQKKFQKYINKLAFIQKMPTAIDKTWFTHKGVMYVRKPLDDSTTGQVVDCNAIIESDMNEGLKVAKCLDIMYSPYFKFQRKDVKDRFLDLPMSKAYPHVLFFFNGVKKQYLRNLEGSLGTLKKMKMQELEKNPQVALQIQNAELLLDWLKNGNGMSLSSYLQKVAL